MKLLCAADVHLGRQPSRLPGDLAERARELGPAAAWRRLVDAALSEQVDALLLAGDVVDRDDDFFEAYADLKRGVERLVEAGVRVLAVAGNHDTKVLPRLVEAVDGFTLLGRGGVWEASTLTGSDGTRVEVVGWSFPDADAPDDPLASGPAARGPDPVPRIGLLHCDRDQAGSRYAPVRSNELKDAPVNAWLLGHVHKPDIAPGDRPMGYLGSLVGTDPGEPGAHGAWLLEVAANGRLDLRGLPLAPLRWEALEVPLDGLEDAGEVPVRIAGGIDRLHRSLQAGGLQAKAVGVRLALVGRTSLRSEIGRTLGRDDPRGMPVPHDGTDYFVHAWSLDALPSHDLAALAGEPSPVGVLARKLRLLRGDGDSDEREALVRAAARRLASVVERPYLIAAGVEPPADARVSELLEKAALDALDALLAQKGSEP